MLIQAFFKAQACARLDNLGSTKLWSLPCRRTSQGWTASKKKSWKQKRSRRSKKLDQLKDWNVTTVKKTSVDNSASKISLSMDSSLSPREGAKTFDLRVIRAINVKKCCSGRLHRIEIAFLLLIQQPQVRFMAFLKIYFQCRRDVPTLNKPKDRKSLGQTFDQARQSPDTQKCTKRIFRWSNLS